MQIHCFQRFFKDQTVANHLLLKQGDSWIAKGVCFYNLAKLFYIGKKLHTFIKDIKSV